MITIPTGDLTGILADTIPFALDTDDLPFLNCVHIEWDGQQLHALTTDRFRVGISTWEPGDIGPGEEAQDDMFTNWGTGDDPWATTLSLADAKELVKVFSLGKKELQTPLTLDYEQERDRTTVKRSRDTGHSAITIVAEGTGAEFPNVRKLLNDTDKAGRAPGLAFNARFLADFGKVRPRGPLELKFTGKQGDGLTHVRIGDRFVGGIVPIRLGDEDTAPAPEPIGATA